MKKILKIIKKSKEIIIESQSTLEFAFMLPKNLRTNQFPNFNCLPFSYQYFIKSYGFLKDPLEFYISTILSFLHAIYI